jgi:NDP-sugar pyrophosphorylase family protein
MVKVAGRPILERIILHLVGFGIRRIFISVNYLSEVIEQHFRDGSALGCKIEYLRETKPLGTGGSLSLLPERPEHPLLVLNGDLLTEFDLGRMIAFHEEGNYAATVGVHEYVQTVPLGVLDIAENRIVGFREKPSFTYATNAGIYLLNPDLLERIPRDETYTIPALVEDCLAKGQAVGAFRIEDEWLDIGRPQELGRALGRE